MTVAKPRWKAELVHGGHRGSLWVSCYCLATRIDGPTSYWPHRLDTAPNLSSSEGIRRTGWTI